ncbi:multiple antibiotic resistance protein [Arboricoccus pini]|uniref:UPF0056 membrane protein n=1 Tax=Arboricoccus pini TaxID=1963835 RepID=A0A212QMF6_9PROT|nr:MarC family protein [Arboricoccus pini]SNB60580.1 multiple antibiotic resistance protein [Arboricoccus pini]
MFEAFWASFVVLVVIVDPVALVPIFIALTQGLDDGLARRIALRGPLISFVVLLVFAYGGERLLATLGIGTPAFRIAGGLLLFTIAFEMLFEKRGARKEGVADRAARSDEDSLDLAAFPLAVPLISGPGAIASVVLLMEQYGSSWRGQAAVIGAVATTLLLTFLMLRASAPVQRVLGRTVINTLSRVLGIIVAALAVQIVVTGITSIYPP